MSNPKTILVIDDEAVIRRSFCDQLEDLGYLVVDASNGQEGLQLLQSQTVDLVLTDLRMPVMGGLEFISFSKRLDADLPIIVISGAGRVSDAVETLRLGADDYLIKPVSDLDSLHHTVEKALEKSRLVQENRAYQDNLEEMVLARTQELERVNNQMHLMQKMEAVGQLTGGIAHDFNNILSIILGNVEIIQSKFSGPMGVAKKLEKIVQAANRGTNLIAQLMSFSGSQNSEFVSVDINLLVRGMDVLIGRAVTPLIQVEHQLAPDLWPTCIDVGDFDGALLNLVINAHDAITGNGCITVGTRNCEIDQVFCSLNPAAQIGQYVCLTVTDTGGGMSAEIQSRVFEPFFTTKEKDKGTGLGLAMVYGFVERSSGFVTLKSEFAVGTTFCLYLPRATKTLQEPRCETASLPPEVAGEDTILLVDDEPELLALAEITLVGLGYKVVTANDGDEAMLTLAQHPQVTLLFSDIIMPGTLNGYQLAQQASKEKPELKVLLTSGYVPQHIGEPLQAHFKDNFLDKPYSQHEMAQRIGQILSA